MADVELSDVESGGPADVVAGVRQWRLSLRLEGALDPAGESVAAGLVELAEAVRESPTNAALWQALWRGSKLLREVAQPSADTEFAALMAMFSDVPTAYEPPADEGCGHPGADAERPPER